MTFVFAGEVSPGRDGRPFSDVVASELREFLPRVRVLPALRHEELWPLVSGSRFVVLPSRFDNLPNACLEAMALSKPVIATEEASFDELIETGVSGELVPQDSAKALVRGDGSLLANAKGRARPHRLCRKGGAQAPRSGKSASAARIALLEGHTTAPRRTLCPTCARSVLFGNRATKADPPDRSPSRAYLSTVRLLMYSGERPCPFTMKPSMRDVSPRPNPAP